MRHVVRLARGVDFSTRDVVDRGCVSGTLGFGDKIGPSGEAGRRAIEPGQYQPNRLDLDARSFVSRSDSFQAPASPVGFQRSRLTMR